MIIQINATVCAAVDHGEGKWHKIAGNNNPRECRKAWKRASKQEKQEIGERDRNVGSSGRRRCRGDDN